VLAGRESEIDELVGLLGARKGGYPRLVLIDGVPGVGKTSLAREFTARARERGYTVAWAHLHDDVRTRSFKLWDEVCRDWLRQSGDGRIEAGYDEASGDTYLALLREFGRKRPTLVVLDNLHLAPTESVDLARTILEDGDGDLPLAIATVRSEPKDKLSSLAGHPGTLTIALGNLDLDAVAQLVQARGIRLPDTAVAHLHALTEGSPVLLSLLLDLLRLEGTAELESETTRSRWDARAADYAGPLMRRKLRALSDGQREIMKLAAALRGEFDPSQLARFAGLPREATESACRAAVALGLFTASPSRISTFRFAGSLTREGILRSFSPADCARAHESIARVLEQTNDGASSELQYHLLHSFSEEAIRRGIDLARKAGAAAIERFDWVSAQRTFRLLLTDCADRLDAEELAEAQHGAARSLLHSGDKMGALPYFKSALESFRRAGDTGRMVQLGLEPIGFEIGDTDYSSIVGTIRELIPQDTPESSALDNIYAVGRMQALGDFRTAWETFSSLNAEAERGGRRRSRLYSTCALAYLDVRFGRIDVAIARCEQVLDACRPAPDHYAQFHARFVLTQAYLARRDTRSARTHAESAMEDARGIGDTLPITMWYSWIIRLRTLEGDWQSARRFAVEALLLDRGHPLILGQLANLEHRVGNFEQGDRHLDELIGSISRYPSGPYLAYALTALTITARNRIRGDGKYLPVAREIVSMLLGQNCHPAVMLRALMAQGLIADATHDTALSREVYGRLVSAPRFNLVRDYRVEHVLGILAAGTGNSTRARFHLESAAEDARRYPDMPAMGWTRADLGSVIAASPAAGSNDGEAEQVLGEALSIARRLGMLPLAEQMEHRLGAIGAGGARGRLTDGVDAVTLSGRERQVLRLVAEGMSDKEIARVLSLSVHTVANHVRHILGKTGVPNRVTAVRFAREEGLV